MAGQIIISVLVSSLVLQVSKPEHVGTLGGEPDALGSQWGRSCMFLTFVCCVWMQALGKYQRVEKETDMLLSTLSAMQEKAQHLECNLSAETRIKLDLFSVLGDTRRQLEIAQGFSVYSSVSCPITLCLNCFVAIDIYNIEIYRQWTKKVSPKQIC